MKYPELSIIIILGIVLILWLIMRIQSLIDDFKEALNDDGATYIKAFIQILKTILFVLWDLFILVFWWDLTIQAMNSWSHYFYDWVKYLAIIPCAILIFTPKMIYLFFKKNKQMNQFWLSVSLLAGASCLTTYLVSLFGIPGIVLSAIFIDLPIAFLFIIGFIPDNIESPD